MTELINVSRYTYLLHPCITSLITSCDITGKANIITIAWTIPVSVDPPMLAFAISPSRYSYELIRATGEFVVNIASYQIAQQALYCGRTSGREVDKFTATGLTAAPAQIVRPPIIQECIAHIECRLAREAEAGDHQLVIGDVLAAYTKKDVINENELYNLHYTKPLLHLGRNWFTSILKDAIEPEIKATPK